MATWINHLDLHELPLSEAVDIKFSRGRGEYRESEDEPFKGNPLHELHDEGLDGIAYARVALGGCVTDQDTLDVQAIRYHFEQAVILARRLIRRAKPPHSKNCVGSQ